MKTILENEIFNISAFTENKNYEYHKQNILTNLPKELIDEAVSSIQSWETYKPTPLHSLDKLSTELNLKNIFYKDEGYRFDLKSFKALGGAYAVNKVVKDKNAKTVATATAGNHGRSVAWGAKRLGINCKIFISEFVSESRANAMRNLGADVIRVKGNYDASLKECIKQSNENGWEIVQDVSWDGYKEVPKFIMAGYSIMIKETIDQLKDNSITHVFLQAGVGGMAASAIAGFANYYKDTPKFIIVEPEDADCVFKSIENGKPTSVNIKKESIMGGISCGDVSTVAWQILKNSSKYCVTISDQAISTTVALLSEKKLSNEKIISGECGVPGVISLIGLCKNQSIRDQIGLDSNANVLVIGCEGLTDREMFEKLLNQGLKQIQ